MIFRFMTKPRVKNVRNTIHDIPVDNQTSFKKGRNIIHDIPVYNQTSCKNSKKYNS